MLKNRGVIIGRIRKSRQWALPALAALLCFGGWQKPMAGAEPEEVITSTRRFWDIPPEERQKTYRVNLEFVVLYYDFEWQLLWVLGDDGVTFIRCSNTLLPIKVGQRIACVGMMSPAAGLSLDQVDIRVVGDDATLVFAPWRFQGTENEVARLPSQVVSVEGFVNRQSDIDNGHVLLDMTVQGWPVQARILLRGGEPKTQCESAFVRAQGVLVPNTTPAGKLSALALWIARSEDVKVIGWLRTDPRFDRTATPIEGLAGAPAEQLVKVAGTVKDQEPGHSLTIRDGTGQVKVLTGQAQALKSGEAVEAIGYPSNRGPEAVLREGLYRSPKKDAGAPVVSAAAGVVPLRLAEQVLELGNEEAARAHVVRLFGYVTWAAPNAPFWFLNDASGGICVTSAGNRRLLPVQGDSVHVEGVSAAGDFAPVVKATTVTVAGSLGSPEARAVTLEQAMTGIEEGQWIELSGYLRDVTRDGAWARLDLTSSAGAFSALLPPSYQLAPLRGSVLRVQGVCTAIANDRQQLVGIRLWVPSLDYLRVEQAAPSDPFSVPERSIASLRQFNRLSAFNRRVRIAGVVLHHAPGMYLNIQDGSESLQVLSRDTAPLTPGSRIEAVGFPGWEGTRLVLREAVVRSVGRGVEPPPITLIAPENVGEKLDGHLVRVSGTLLDVTVQTEDCRLLIQAGTAVVEALLANKANRQAPGQWLPGSRLAVTGVYRVESDEYGQPRTGKVRLRSAQDVEVLEQPPWWTSRRARAATVVLAVLTVLVIGWVVTLRRRVRQQTGQIRTQLQKEARLEAELQRSSRLESLGILAGGIAHDFNNLLTVIMGNLTLAKLDSSDPTVTGRWLPAAEQGVMRARDLTMQLLTFAKGGDPVRKAVDLSGVVREAAEFALHGSKVRCEFEFAADLWPAEVDKGQIGQVVQNIIINALQAMPDGGTIRVSLANAVVDRNAAPDLAGGRYLELSIADNGQGINPEYLPRIFDPYFTTKPQGSGLGLATVYSIVKKHLGRIEAQSKVGEGTLFRIWLPAAQRIPEPMIPADEEPVRLRGRVLVMDDDEAIRESATSLLQRLGLDPQAVGDGAAALRDYTAARDSGRPFDLVILDLTVPGGMGGRETIEKLRQIDPRVRAIVSSGYSGDPVLARYREHGFLGRVPKPYDLPELTKVVRAVLQGEAL